MAIDGYGATVFVGCWWIKGFLLFKLKVFNLLKKKKGKGEMEIL
jgi:hypothetical protein